MTYLRNLKGFDGGGLLGALTPFQSTKVTCNGDCGSFSPRGTFNFKWIFVCSVTMRVTARNGKIDFYRVQPAQGYACDTLRVVRGKPA
jgi:hypothetical protein